MFLTANSQNMDTMSNVLDVLLLVMLVGSGIYGLYSVIRLRRSCLLFPNKFLYPGNCAPEDCVDEDGFIDFITPRLAALSIALLLMGAAYAVRIFCFAHIYHWAVEGASLLLPLVAFVWYVVIQRKAAKEFW